MLSYSVLDLGSHSKRRSPKNRHNKETDHDEEMFQLAVRESLQTVVSGLTAGQPAMPALPEPYKNVAQHITKAPAPPDVKVGKTPTADATSLPSKRVRKPKKFFNVTPPESDDDFHGKQHLSLAFSNFCTFALALAHIITRTYPALSRVISILSSTSSLKALPTLLLPLQTWYFKHTSCGRSISRRFNS